MLLFLSHDVRQQRHEASAFDRDGELALMPGAHARTAARDDLSKGGKVAAQGVSVLVVDLTDISLTEEAMMFDWSLSLTLLHRVSVHAVSGAAGSVRDE